VDHRGQGFHLFDRIAGFLRDRALAGFGQDQVRFQIRLLAQHLEQPNAEDHSGGSGDPDDEAPFHDGPLWG
jgi:hypothetical protein